MPDIEGPYFSGGYFGDAHDARCPDCNAELTCAACNTPMLPLVPMDGGDPVGVVCPACLRRNAEEVDQTEPFRGGEGYVGGAFSSE